MTHARAPHQRFVNKLAVIVFARARVTLRAFFQMAQKVVVDKK